MRSVTLKAFFGFVRKRARGDLRSDISGLGERGASMEVELSLSDRLSRLSTMRFGVSQHSFGYFSWRVTYYRLSGVCRRRAVP